MATQASYRAIKADLLGRITRGEWPPGSLIPTEVELAASYGAARATVNRAVRELADDGIVERRRKAGTRVRLAPQRQARFDIPIVRRQIEDAGAAYRYALLEREATAAPDWLRARLGLEAGAEAVHLTCLHLADGSPYQYEDRWINPAVLPAVHDADFTAIGPNEWLVAAIPFSSVEISFSAVAAEAPVAAAMGCAPGDPLMQVERATWLEDRPVTHVRMVHQRGYRMTTRY